MAKETPYVPEDRDARRLEDNAAGNTVTEGAYELEDDDVARSTYPDPKARHLNRDSETLKRKRELREQDDAHAALDNDPVTDPVDTAAVKVARGIDGVPPVVGDADAKPAPKRARTKK